MTALPAMSKGVQLDSAQLNAVESEPDTCEPQAATVCKVQPTQQHIKFTYKAPHFLQGGHQPNLPFPCETLCANHVQEAEAHKERTTFVQCWNPESWLPSYLV